MGGLECTQCTSGFFTPTAGLSQCEDCSQDFGKKNCVGGAATSDAPYDHCRCLNPCLPGTFGAHRPDCKPCSSGRFYPYAGATTNEQCSACPLGRYGDQTGADSSEACIACSKGRINPTSGSNASSACIPCRQGHYQPSGDGAASCEPCAAGKYGDETEQQQEAKACKDCRAGKFSAAEGASEPAQCTTCPNGKYGQHAGAKSPNACAGCLQGRFNPASGSNSSAACKPCRRGRYQASSEGAASCESCTAGKYGDQTGQHEEAGSCRTCKAGRFSAAEGASSSAQCTECPIGKYGEQAGANAAEGCVGCRRGRFNSVSSSSSSSACKPCARGRYQASSDGAASCEACIAGKYGGQTGQTDEDSCVDCEVGKYGAAAGASQCAECAIGKYGNQAGAKVADSCIGCLQGRFNPSSGGNSPSSCKPCQHGRYQTSSAGAASCEACAAGKYGDQTGQQQPTKACVDCRAGKYGAAAGASEAAQCTECPIGKYGEQAGATKADTCKPCAASKFGIGPGKPSEATGCRVCETPGYQDETGRASCKPASCPAGQWGSRPPHCTNCTTGTYFPSRGLKDASGCLSCSAGSVSSVPGAIRCRTCPVREIASKGATHCICDRNYYRVDGRCIPCPDALDCSRTGSTLEGALLKPGHWRAGKLAREFYPCRVPAACNRSFSSSSNTSSSSGAHANTSSTATGNMSSISANTNSSAAILTGNKENYYCAAGQRGPLCALCETGFSRWSNKVMCTPCPEELGTGIVMSILSIIGMLALLVLCLYFNRKAPNGILRPLINAAQMMMVVLMFPVDWPDSVMIFSLIVEGINFSFIKLASPTCVGMPINFYWRLIIMMAVTGAVIGLPWLVSLRLRRKDAKKWDGAIKARLRDTFLIVVLLHPTLAGMAFYHFRCQTVANTSYLMADYSLVCGDETWHWMLIPVLFVIIFFALGMPLLFAFVLWRRRHKLLDDPKTKRLYGMLYSAYKPDFYYFESVIMFFKLGLWAILVFFKHGSQFQLAASALLCVLQLGVHARYEPYEDYAKNVLQYLGLIVIALTSFSGLVLNYLKTSRELAIERGDKQGLADLERSIAGLSFVAEFTLWLGVVLVVIRVGVAAVKFLRKHGSSIKSSAIESMRVATRRFSSAVLRLKSAWSSHRNASVTAADGNIEMAQRGRAPITSRGGGEETKAPGGNEHSGGDDGESHDNETKKEERSWSFLNPVQGMEGDDDRSRMCSNPMMAVVPGAADQEDEAVRGGVRNPGSDLAVVAGHDDESKSDRGDARPAWSALAPVRQGLSRHGSQEV